MPYAASNGEVRFTGRAEMNMFGWLIAVVVVVLAVLVVFAIMRMRANARIRSQPMRKRALDLEARVKTVLTGPRQKYGDIFADYSVWRSDRETRLELVATDRWSRLNEFTRCLVVRYLWRVLESLAGGAVVVVDQPPQEWNVEVDAGFRDQGFDWKTFGHGPQFVEE
jgi:hypothetical protein